MKINLNWLLTNWMSLLALIVSIIAAFFAFDQNRTTKRLSHLHIMPVIKSIFVFPVKGNPLFSITNIGDIPVVSLSVEHSMYVFDKNKSKMSSAMKIGYLFGDRMIYVNELNPNQHKNQELARVDPVLDKVIAYKFDLKYYRESDMDIYRRQEIFFVDDGITYDHRDYRKNNNYYNIMTGIEKYQFPVTKFDPDKLKMIYDTIDKNDDKKLIK